MSADRREHLRYPVKWKARVSLDKEVSAVQVHDVSMGGLGVTFDYAIAVGTPMNVEFFVTYQNEIHRIRAKTKVAFNTIMSNNAGAKLGLQFIFISKNDRQLLENVLQQLEETGC